MAEIKRRTIAFPVRVPVDLVREFGRIAQSKGMTPTHLARIAIQEYVWKFGSSMK